MFWILDSLFISKLIEGIFWIGVIKLLLLLIIENFGLNSIWFIFGQSILFIWLNVMVFVFWIRFESGREWIDSIWNKVFFWLFFGLDKPEFWLDSDISLLVHAYNIVLSASTFALSSIKLNEI